MRKIISAALIAIVAVPVVAPATASAQNREARQDRRDYRQDRRQDRRDYRDDRNRRWGDNDWRDWRGRNRSLYSRGSWRAPFRYQSWRPGVRISASFWGPRYRISDPWRYRLPIPGRNRVWVRHYDDLLLVDMRRGTVVRVIRNFYW